MPKENHLSLKMVNLFFIFFDIVLVDLLFFVFAFSNFLLLLSHLSCTVMCNDCVEGKYQHKNDQPSVSCQQCTVGKEWKTTSTDCESCSKGKYQDQNNIDSAKCLFCSKGKSFVSENGEFFSTITD